MAFQKVEFEFPEEEQEGTAIEIEDSGEVEIDLAGYWKYMYEKCIVSTEPNLSKAQLMGLNGYVGSQVSAILPQPTDLLTGPLGIGNDE